MCSFERRIAKVDALIDEVQSGRLTPEQMIALQHRLRVRDAFDGMTADEEGAEDGRERNEVEEERALSGVVATSLADREEERRQVKDLLDLAQRVYESGHEAKFEKLCEVIRDPKVQGPVCRAGTGRRETHRFHGA